MQQKLSTVAVLLLVAAAATPSLAQTVVTGTLADGPASQGVCSSAGSDTFFCENGAFCTWRSGSSNFSCVGGTGTVTETETTDSTSTAGSTDTSSGPPGRDCTAHEGHWDCSDGSFCELTNGEWSCTGGTSASASGSESSSGSEGGACVVHGGHTHGDCSGSCNGVDLGEYNMDLHIVALL